MLTLILANPVSNGQAVTLSYTDPSSGNDTNAIQDASGNDTISLSPQIVANNTLDNVPPVFVSASISGNVLTMTYAEAGLLNSTTAPASAFSVTNGGIANSVTSVSVDTNAKTVLLFLANAVSNGQAVTVSYLDPGSGNDANAIQDTAGNDALSFTAQTVANNTVDNIAPVFASASVNGNALTISYSEADLLSATTAAANAFSVTNGGAVNSVTAVAVDTSAKKITLTLSNAVTNGQAVTVSYNDPTSGNDDAAVQDVSGNDAVSFAAQTVNNLTAASAVITSPVIALPNNTITALPADTRTYDTELSLSEDADTLDGSPGNEKFLGLGGNDTLNGKEGNDYLDGGAGNDALDGGAGDDYLLGGDGNDLINDSLGNNSIDGGAGNDSIVDYYSSAGNVDGGEGDDSLTVYYGKNNTVHGGNGNDNLSSAEADSSLYGDAGNDTITTYSEKGKAYGGDGNDTLSGYGLLDGGTGNDILNNDRNTTTVFYGGADSDTIITNKAKATIQYYIPEDSKVGAGNRDIMTDFDTSSGATFELYHLGSLSYIGSAAFNGTSGAVRFVVEPANKWTLVQVDMNGDNTADMEIELTGLKFLSADDFVLVQPV